MPSAPSVRPTREGVQRLESWQVGGPVTSRFRARLAPLDGVSAFAADLKNRLAGASLQCRSALESGVQPAALETSDQRSLWHRRNSVIALAGNRVGVGKPKFSPDEEAKPAAKSPPASEQSPARRATRPPCVRRTRFPDRATTCAVIATFVLPREAASERATTRRPPHGWRCPIAPIVSAMWS